MYPVQVLLCRPSYQREYFQLMIAGERSGRHVEGYVDPEGFNARKVSSSLPLNVMLVVIRNQSAVRVTEHAHTHSNF